MIIGENMILSLDLLELSHFLLLIIILLISLLVILYFTWK